MLLGIREQQSVTSKQLQTGTGKSGAAADDECDDDDDDDECGVIVVWHVSFFYYGFIGHVLLVFTHGLHTKGRRHSWILLYKCIKTRILFGSVLFKQGSVVSVMRTMTVTCQSAASYIPPSG